jgi:hypothetical protein
MAGLDAGSKSSEERKRRHRILQSAEPSHESLRLNVGQYCHASVSGGFPGAAKSFQPCFRDRTALHVSVISSQGLASVPRAIRGLKSEPSGFENQRRFEAFLHDQDPKQNWLSEQSMSTLPG